MFFLLNLADFLLLRLFINKIAKAFQIIRSIELTVP